MTYNKILRYYSCLKDAAKEKSRLQTGFSMLEAVVVVGVLLALAVGGFFAYGPIVQNAKLAKLKSAASQVYTAATVNQIDGDPTTQPQDAIDAWNASSTSIKVGFFDTKVIATPAMTTAEGDYTPTEGEDFCIQATDISKPEIEAKSGDCPVPPEDGSLPPGEDGSEEIPTQPLSTLKNGDFSEGLNFWAVAGVNAPTVANGEAVLSSGSNQPVSLAQTVSIPSSGITHLKYSYRLSAASHNTAITRINVYDPTGKLLKEIKNTELPAGAATPVTVSTVELTEFAGQNVKVELHYTAGPYSTPRIAYLDNFSLETTKEVPSEPLDVKVSVAVTDAAISWTAPISGSASVTSYTITPHRNGSDLPPLVISGAAPLTSTIFKGITSGGDYTFTVVATNSFGASKSSIPSATYSSPVELLKNGDFSAGLTAWLAAGYTQPTVTNGEAVLMSGSSRSASLLQTVSVPASGITYLKYSYRVGAASHSTSDIRVNVYDPEGNFIKEAKKITIPNSPATAAALSSVDFTEFAGKDIKVQLHHTAGPYSTERAAYLDNISMETVKGAPSVPTAVKVNVADTDATVTWTSPFSGSASVSSYTVTPYRNGTPLTAIIINGSPPVASTVFKGMTSGGSYTFTVTATNRLGTSESSTPSEVFIKTTKSLENGDFSAGLTGWVAAASVGSTQPTTLNGEAVLYSGANKPATLLQTVSVPANGNANLKYSYRLGSASYNSADIRVNVYDPTGNFIKEMKKITVPKGPATTVAQSTVDFTEFAGQDIKLEFHYMAGPYSTERIVYLDNISMETGQ